MGAINKYMFCVIVVMFSFSFAKEYDSKTNFRKITILENKLQTVLTRLQFVEEDLKVEKYKSVEFENKFKAMIGNNKVPTLDNTDSDLHKHEFVVDQQRTVDQVSSTIEQRVYQAMNDEKKIRKQFQNQMQTTFKTEKENMEIKFTSLNKTLSAVIDKKLETIEDVVLDSITLINNSINEIEDLKSNIRQNEEAITIQRVESDQLNTTLLIHGATLYSLNDSLVDVRASVEEQLDNSHHFKVCLHGGQHTEDGLCECSLPYYGTHCEKVCFNGGKHSVDGQCECVLPYFGTKCEKVCFNGDTHSEDGVCDCLWPYYGTQCEKAYEDCYDIHKQTDKPSGLYEVQPRGMNETIKVKCDMTTDGGGWTVFQYRYDGSVEFYRNFSSFENGFGSLTGEFWIGLRYIQAIASSAPTTLRIEMEAADRDKAYQQFEDFYLSEGPDYKLNIGKSSGTAGDSNGLSRHKGGSFTTYDRDRDGAVGNCAEHRHGGWWYSGCGYVNLNGYYTTPGTKIKKDSFYYGMFYRDFKSWNSLKSSKMMIRRN